MGWNVTLLERLRKMALVRLKCSKHLMTPIPCSLLRGYLMRTINYGSVEYPVACGGDLLFNDKSAKNDQLRKRAMRVKIYDSNC